ncbi:Spy/CpxP family protein refolding chaperone [Dyella sp. 20L07]|uniref:Spy/CpxP family protein refolding chaperone n=1 Tax=Dyella sp. 20L07 TaxID=3384240 RepID=UPI003D2A2FBC
MNPSLRSVATPAVLAFALLTAPAWAQTSPMPGATNAAAATKDHAQKHADAVEQRITELHTKLKITDQQSKPWDAFAQTMRDNAQKADQSFRDRSQKLSTMSAADAMKSYADITQMHADNMKKLSSAFSDLYAVLSPEQKQLADAMYRNPGGRMGGPPRKGGKGGKTHAPASASSSGGASG